jgi:hypothetical protein
MSIVCTHTKAFQLRRALGVFYLNHKWLRLSTVLLDNEAVNMTVLLDNEAANMTVLEYTLLIHYPPYFTNKCREYDS